jgi:DNA recombination protein RmuC
MDAISLLTGLIVGVFLGIIFGLYIWRGLISDKFGNLAGTALKNNNEQFIALANEKLAPFKDKLAEYQTLVSDIETRRVGAYSSLETKIADLKNSQSELQQITASLSTALRNPQVRGRWGELTLQRLVELAGMVQFCDFNNQVTASDDERIIRPDMIVNLPSERKLIVDSKVPLKSYLDSLETNNDSERVDLIRKHAQAIREHLKALASKKYWEQFDAAPEFVVMFIPGEAFLYAALEVDRELIEDGMKSNVVISTPTTLISLLKAVARGWSEKKMEESARKIGELGKELFERLTKMNEAIGDVGKKIERSVDSYNKLVATFDSRVLVSARRFGELGVGNTADIDMPEQLEKTVREVSDADREAN